VGGHEMAVNFIDEGIDTKAGQKFILEVLDFMRNVLVEYQKDGGLYNLEATPAEGTSYRLARIDKKEFPDIFTSGTSEIPYYTNSTQMPVNYSDDLFEVLDIQDKFQTKYTGGTVLHGFIGEEIMDYHSIKSLLKTVFSDYRLPYLTVTPTFSVCPVHGYIAGEHHICPRCVVEQKCEVYSRVVGYIRPVLNWHDGKKQEFKDRVTFNYKKGINAIIKPGILSKKK
jgi:ribonucleoside-triphosphate reductase